jgi:hypothetical protein
MVLQWWPDKSRPCCVCPACMHAHIRMLTWGQLHVATHAVLKNWQQEIMSELECPRSMCAFTGSHAHMFMYMHNLTQAAALLGWSTPWHGKRVPSFANASTATCGTHLPHTLALLKRCATVSHRTGSSSSSSSRALLPQPAAGRTSTLRALAIALQQPHLARHF